MMGNLSKYAEMVRCAVSMQDALNFYGFTIKGNRIACPFHGGKGFNLGYNRTVWHCFVCGESGDLISFIMKYFRIDFKAALQMLNRDFKLGLPIDETDISLRKFRDAEKRAREYREKREQEQQKEDELEKEYLAALEAWIELDKMCREYAPKQPTDEIDDRYVYAIMHINEAETRLDDAEGARRAYAYRR